MKISWVIAADYRMDPTVDINQLKSVGPIWGSWQTWRACSTDNVVCHDQKKCRELLDRAFQAVCNFYAPKSLYETLARPVGVRLYDGEFEHELDNIEDVIAMHLAASDSDIVLLLGFDLLMPQNVTDRFAQHKLVNRHGLIRGAISGMPNTQWVAVDTQSLDKSYQTVPNLTCDSLENVLKLLV